MNSKKSKIKNKYATRSKRSAKTSAAAPRSKTQAGPSLAKKNSQARASGLKDKIHLGAAYVGDSFEKMGKKMQKSGYIKVGRAIEKMGIRVEHLA